MKALTCELCGGTNLIKQDGVFVCQSCGTKYSVEEAKKMMIEGTVSVEGTVKVDTSEELKNLYEIARRAKDSENNEKAEKYYDMILVKDPNSWEANFYTTYFSAMSCKIGEISNAAEKIANCFKSTIDLIKKNLEGAELNKAIGEIWKKSENISILLSSAAINQYKSIDSEIKDQFTVEYMTHVFNAATIMFTLGNELEELNKKQFRGLIENAWKTGISILTSGMDACPLIDPTDSKSTLRNVANEFERKISDLNPEYVAQTHESSGCIVTIMVMLTAMSSLVGCVCLFVGLF